MKNTKVIDGSSLKAIPDFYQVKVWHKGQKELHRFGIIDWCSPEAKKAWKKRQLIIEDAVSPKSFRVNVDEVEIQPIGLCIGMSNEYETFVAKHYFQSKKLSNKVNGIGVGKMFTVGVADGNAHYIITGVTARNVTVEWRGYSPDRYRAPMLGLGGTFPKSCIKSFVGFNDWQDYLRKKEKKEKKEV